MQNQLQAKNNQHASFSIFDKLDEEQIINADKIVKQKMVYKYKDHEELTFVGLKFIILEMAKRGEPLESEKSEIALEKDGTDSSMWFWRAKVIVRNQVTNYTSEGLSECPYLQDGTYDPFGRVKAHSKAERNAWRKQIPEQRFVEFLKAVKKEDVEVIAEEKNETVLCKCNFETEARPNTDYTICLNCGGAINSFMKKKLEILKK